MKMEMKMKCQGLCNGREAEYKCKIAGKEVYLCQYCVLSICFTSAGFKEETEKIERLK